MAALSEEIRSVVACLSGQIDKGRVDAATAARARDILRDVADRVELIEDLIIPTSVTLPDVPRPGTNVVRLDPHRTRAARPVGQPHHSPSTPA